MKNLIVNVDAGEHEKHRELDLELLSYVDALNIALGAHAGDAKWSRELAKRAEELGKRVHLHPGYADRERFGRVDLNLDWSELSSSLSIQRDVLPDVTTCKFHGAIYNRSIVDREFAEQLVQWCLESGVDKIVTMDGGCLAVAARNGAIGVLREAFVDRRYIWGDDHLELQPRIESGAVIVDISAAVGQATLISCGYVVLADGSKRPIQCDTICFHGDGKRATELATAIHDWKRDS